MMTLLILMIAITAIDISLTLHAIAFEITDAAIG
jgi:hypothetical protein